MKFSVIICTYNQSRSLRLVLEYLQKQIVSEGDFELLVVDNNSKDDTRAVCEACFPAIPFACRYIFEGRQGLSVARNRGLAEAGGDILIFTDDDARLPADWLQNYAWAYREHGADCVFGRITVDWDRGQPDWYSDDFSAMFVALDYGNDTLTISDLHHEFYGKNFSVRKAVLRGLGGFDEKLGRIGDRLFLGEETRIYRGLVEGGYKVVYFPQLHVGHMLKDYEYTEAHCRKHVRDATLSEYYMMQTANGRKVLGRPIYALKKSLGLLALALAAYLRSRGYAANFYAKIMFLKSLQLFRLWILNRA